jgi:hypothetical protein
MHFHRDKRYTRGGFYTCTVKDRAKSRRYYAENAEKVCAQKRDRYDNDPFFRIQKRMTDDARQRRYTINRRKEELDGQVSLERRDRPDVEPHPASADA